MSFNFPSGASIRLHRNNYWEIANRIVEKGKRFDSQRGRTYEILNAQITLKNVHQRMIIDDRRKLNPAFAIVEWLGLMTGDDDLELYTRYNSTINEFSSDGEKVDGAYANRVHNRRSGFTSMQSSQIDQVIRILSQDTRSRRGIVSIYDADDTFGAGGKNTPCTLGLHFYVRDGHLCCTVDMRSNDIYWGFPYDMFMFSMIQEHVYRKVKEFHPKLKLGPYFHFAHSLHLYVRFMKYVRESASNPPTRWVRNMLPMDRTFDDSMLRVMTKMAKERSPQDIMRYGLELHNMDFRYAGNLMLVLGVWLDRKQTNQPLWKDAYRAISDPTLKRSLKPWIKR